MGSSQVQGRLWGAKARDWAYLFEPMSKPVWVAMLDSAGVQNGTRFVDLGCGGGGAGVMAGKRGAQVSGLDAAEALIQIARERIADSDFRVGDLEALSFDNDSFDVSFSSMSVMFANDILKALGEMKRITSPGGRVTVGVWGDPIACEYRHILKAIADTLPAPPSGGGPFSLSERGVLEGMMQDAGLTIVDHGDVDAPFEFADSETMWRLVSSVGPVQAARESVSEEKLKSSVMRAAEPYRKDSGVFSLNNRLRYVTAVA